eukprot:CAMPEP_0197657662 /NCGR_PEP_ID=MMETSP1338-20131121/44771_1 /TAXON_ID=43686 ORGANISM="Pelagodinium beii, Strain RCC1491" /NCGR_SAMPLE_ID=MMETSP1338 /ASSEMBLY_ACC=CAM_ASM_000754 /LENGTH=427 /DNA_ID=CAMNT_0043234091 /DNA_START=27 /DNA_END=1310 /DNA_ORIENTATION=-
MSTLPELQALFNKFDSDGNGKISVTELTRLMEMLAKGTLSPAEIGSLLRKIDKNNDGQVDFMEFVQWIQGGRSRLKKKTTLAKNMEVAAEEIPVDEDTSWPVQLGMTVDIKGSIKRWNLQTGEEVSLMGSRTPAGFRFTSVQSDIEHENLVKKPHKEGSLCCAAVNWSSGACITGAGDNTLKLWSQDGSVDRTFVCKGTEGAPLCVQVSWQKMLMICGTTGCLLKMFQLDDAAATSASQRCEGSDGVNCLDVEWDKRRVVCGSGNNVVLWDYAASKTSTKTLGAHTDTVTALCVDWQQDVAISGSLDRTFCYWDLKTCTKLRSVNHAGAIRCMAGASPYDSVITGDSEGVLRVWDSKSCVCVKKLTGHKDAVLSMSKVESGYMASVGRDATLRLWDLSEGVEKNMMQLGEVIEGNWGIAVSIKPPDI